MSSLVFSKLSSGISENSKSGLVESCRFSRNLDIYSDRDSVSLNPIPVKDSAAIVIGLVKWMVDANPFEDVRYAYDASGNIYKVDGGTWTLDRATATIGHSAAGQGLAVLNDYLYYATSDSIGRKGPLSLSGGYNDDFLSDGVYDLDLSDTDETGQTYTTPTSISEAATARQSIVPTTDPLKAIIIIPTDKGTGNWTVTVHDADNNVLGASTVANASLTNGSEATFTLSTPARIAIGPTYHFHVTSTVADGTVQTGTASDLEDCYHKTLFGILIADANYHPLAQHTNGVTGTLIAGNNSYIGEWTQNVYNPNKITLEPGYNVRFFVKENEFQVAGCWRGTSIDGFEEGRYYFWDGISSYYNYNNPVTGGLPNAAANFKNRIFSILGSEGGLAAGVDPFNEIQPAPKLARGKKIEVTPGAMSVWRNRLHIGIGINTDDGSGLEQGVYEFGSQSDRVIGASLETTEVLNYGYQISPGDTQGTTMQIGCVFGVGADLYIAWKDEDSNYGVDKVSKTGNPAATGSWESLILDHGATAEGQIFPMPHKTKLAKAVKVTYVALPTGCTVTPKYKIDRAASFTAGTGEEIGTATSKSVTLPINNRYKEIEIGFDLVATTNYPEITSIELIFDPLLGETEEA